MTLELQPNYNLTFVVFFKTCLLLVHCHNKKCVGDLLQVGVFLWVLRFLLPMKISATI